MNSQNTGGGKAGPTAVSILGRVASTGFAGGLLWSAGGFIAAFFKLAEVSPNMILQPISAGAWKDGAAGNIVSICLLSVISIGIAFIYYLMFRKIHSIWGGIGFGIGLWGLVFFLVLPLFPVLKTAAQLSSDTIVTTLCIYILYGMFIGYSISYDYSEVQKETESKNSKPLEENS
ncbi:YqhR family membrane protein [Metabacillus sp. 84]|uniref:YqhR family membrane protein n=1 Tax=Metabacillus sp. 84 TaxID=3404705 RepID=UPI003CF57369